MNLFLLSSSADTTTPTPPASWTTMLIYLVPIGFLIIYFVYSSKKQKKEEQKVQDMKNSVAIGDEITTIGGIVGRVVFVREDNIVIETTKEKTKIRVLKWAIKSIDVKAAEAE